MLALHPDDWMRLLDTVDWAGVRHAYGSAEDVPEMVRGLVSEEHDDALANLFGTVWHQGTVYDSTAHVVPPLVALVVNGRARDRSGVLSLLAAIAAGRGYHAVHGGAEPEALEFERRWVDAAHSAVAQHEDSFVALLDDADAMVRVGAANVLGWIEPAAEKVGLAIVDGILREPDPIARCGMLLALGRLGSVAAPMTSVFEIRLGDLRTPWNERLAAAIGLARIAGPETPVRCISILSLACSDPEGWECVFSGLPWDWTADERPASALVGCGARATLEIHVMCDALRTLDSASASMVLDDLLELAFPVPFEGTLDATQRSVVRALSEASLLWESTGSFHSALVQFGLWPEGVGRKQPVEARDHLRNLLDRSS